MFSKLEKIVKIFSSSELTNKAALAKNIRSPPKWPITYL
jgi:hypothetical protein